MAFENILTRHREITHGPGAKTFDIGRICDEPYPVQLSVRGLTSDCTCAMGNHCSYCEETVSVWLLIVGTFNPDLHQRGFVFWGYINRDAQGDALRRAPSPADGERVSCDPNRSQLVHGWYTPYPGKGVRGWIAPAQHDIGELFRMFFNTPSLRRTFSLLSDGIDNTELPEWRGRVPRLHPEQLYGKCQRHEGINLRLRHVERQREGYGLFVVKGIEPLAGEGATFQFKGNRSNDDDKPRWVRFKIRIEFYLEDRTGDDHEIYEEAWVDVREDGHWNYIWARLPDGSEVSWVHRNSQ